MTISLTSTPSKRQRWLRRLLWTVVLLAALVPLYYAVENWRGARAWRNARTAYEADRRSLDWDVLLQSETIPEASNFCAIPLLRDLTLPNDPAAEALRQRLSGPSLQVNNLRKARDFENGQPINYDTFREALGSQERISIPQNEPDSARAILVGLEDSVDWFGDLDEATMRPSAQLLPPFRERVDPQQPWLLSSPHLGAIRHMQRWLSYRASAAVGCGEKEKARLSLTSGFRLIQASGSEQTLIAHLVTLTMTSILIRPVWDSLHERIWSDAELQWLESEFAKIDFIMNYKRSLQTEAAFAVTAIDHLKTSPRSSSEFMVFGESPSLARLSLIPNGHFDLEKARRVLDLGRRQDVLNTANFATVKAELEALTKESKNDGSSVFRMLGDISMFNKSATMTAAMDTQIQQARLAVALERHFLKHQAYPQKLSSLIPSFLEALPDDPMGDTWRYKPSTNRQDYRLYSIGWNLIDDGGQPTQRGNRNEGDFVWIR